MNMSYSETANIGKIVIAPEVLITIAKLSTLSVNGVARMAQISGGMDRYFKRGTFDGVRIEVIDAHTLTVELFIALSGEANVQAVSEQVQAEVTRAMLEMVGMDTQSVTVHIEEIEYGDN
jgi:uncharacterized alkaline shock family protein YloU